MKRTKKFLIAILTFVLLLSVLSLSSCGKKGEENADDNANNDKGKVEDKGNADEGPITLTVYSQLANYSGEQIGWFGQVMLEKFNVKINIVSEADGVFVTRMESGNLGDIVIFGGDGDQYKQAINNGMLFDWNEDNLLSEHGAYIKENMPKAIEKNMTINPDGKLYGFGHNVATSAVDHESFFYHPDIRWDLYKQLGYPPINTLEDLVDVLADMKEICPTSDSGKETWGISMFNDWDGAMVMTVKSTAALYGYDEFGVGLYDVEKQEWQGALEEGGQYLRSLRFHNQLFQRNLIDPDSLTQKFDGASEDYQDGAAFFNIFNYMASIPYNTEEHISQGKAMYALALGDQKTLTYGLNVFGGNRVWTIGATTQYPELCMQIINWLSTPDGRMTLEYGPKGVTWDYDENKKPYLTELGLATKSDGKTEMSGGYSGTFSDGSFQMNNTTWAIDASNPDTDGETYNYNTWASYNETLTSDIMNDWREFTGYTTQDEYLRNLPKAVAIGNTYSESPKGDELEIIWEQVITVIKDYSWKAIYANSDEEYESIVAEMIEKANEYGYDQCVEYCLNEAALRKAAEDKAK